MTVEEKNIYIQGIRVNYKTIGSGKPVLILHGWGGSSDTWRIFLEQHDQKDIMLIAPDLPGFGKSQEPQHAWHVQEYMQFVVDFMNALGIQKWTTIAHSFGGRITFKLESRYPEKTEALILIAVAGIKHKKSVKVIIGNSLAKLGKVVFSLPILDKLESVSRKILYKGLREKDYISTTGVMKETFKNVIEEDLTRYISEIKKPTMVIWGTEDSYVPLADGYYIHEQIKGSVIEVIHGAGHGIHKKMPKRLYQIISHFISHK